MSDLTQPQEYTVQTFKPREYKDQNDNTWCDVLFEEHRSEPITWVVKDPSSVDQGDKVFGHIETKTSQANKPYLRFYRDDPSQYSAAPTAKPEPTIPTSAPAKTGGSSYVPRDDAAIRAQWAIGQSMEWALQSKNPTLHSIEENAVKLFQMVERVKHAVPSETMSADKPTVIPDTHGEDIAADLERGLRAEGQWVSEGGNTEVMV